MGGIGGGTAQAVQGYLHHFGEALGELERPPGLLQLYLQWGAGDGGCRQGHRPTAAPALSGGGCRSVVGAQRLSGARLSRASKGPQDNSRMQ